MLWKIMVEGVRKTKKGEMGEIRGGIIFLSILDKLINCNTIEAYMQKISKIAWKMKTWTPSRISLLKRGEKGKVGELDRGNYF